MTEKYSTHSFDTVVAQGIQKQGNDSYTPEREERIKRGIFIRIAQEQAQEAGRLTRAQQRARRFVAKITSKSS